MLHMKCKRYQIQIKEIYKFKHQYIIKNTVLSSEEISLRLEETRNSYFLCNPQRSGASRVCIIFPQITQKIPTKDIIRWPELITEILSFIQIFSVRKTTTQLF